jgi:plastocyanin
MTRNCTQVRPLPLLISIIVALAISPTLSAAEKTKASGATKSGTVEGVVTYKADTKRPWRYARHYVKNRKTGELAEAVIALSGSGLNKSASRKPKTVVVDQKNFTFIPETTAIQTGDRVKFLNSDKQVHNVMAFHRIRSFNVNMAAGGTHIETFKGATGLKLPYRIGCVYHSAMRAWVFVLDHPYFQVTGKDGKFRLQNVPPGKYKLEMVHPAGNLNWSQDLVVKAGTTMRVPIHVSPDNKPQKRPEKNGAKQ